jgi:hypothetical protein
MRLAYLFPFVYFFDTRLRCNSVSFHVVFEWGAAALVACVLGREAPGLALLTAVYCYIAFISLYEIGYLINDLYSAKREAKGRRRGPQGVGAVWVVLWVLSRISVFMVVSFVSGLWTLVEWWMFFGGMCVAFALHNLWIDQDLKVATFLWLAWFRFMAPIVFVVQTEDLMGVAFAAGVIYVGFRLFGYLDSKGLLIMPGRQRTRFRLAFFLLPFVAVIPLTAFENSRGFVLIACYFAACALAGSLFRKHVTSFWSIGNRYERGTRHHEK